ncbi:hypothetical protein SME46J_49270 (plasmid) [Serratia marcescens]|nr:hypothetical protein SME46J_49270 [Serratia marcescens]
MSVYTIFFCGTGSNRTDSSNGANSDFFHNGELISTLARNMKTAQYKDWIIVDGPGSGNLQEGGKWVKPGNHWGVTGALLGKGWENNVQHALAVLKKDNSYFANKPGYTKQYLQYEVRLFNKDMPTQVNLVGWSRGGVTCHMMANAMLNDPMLSTIPVNIFAIDPVPGLGQFAKHRTMIGSNVRDYCVVYARDERSLGFGPTLPTLGNTGKTHIYGMPGRHATVVGNASTTGGGEHSRPTNYPQPGEVVRWMVENKLTEWGASLGNRLGLTEMDILDRYDDMLRHEPDYFKMRNNVYTVKNRLSSDRHIGEDSNFSRTKWHNVKMLREPSIYSSGTDAVFINNHHMNLFINLGIIHWSEENTIRRFPATWKRIKNLNAIKKQQPANSD